MSGRRHKNLRACNAWWRAQGPNYETKNTSSYGSALKAAGRRGFRHRTTEGMFYHMPNEPRGEPTENERKWPSKTIYLLYFGEPLHDVQLALAQFIMVHPHRTNYVLLSCKGERPCVQ